MIRAFIVAASLLLAGCGGALAQGCGVTNPSCIVPTAPAGTSNNQAASTAFVQGSVAALPLASGKIYIGSAGGVAVGQTVSGDCTLAVNGTITCTKLNSVSPGALFALGVGTGLTSNGGNLNLTVPVTVANGGTNATSAGATAANNIGALAEANNLSDVASAAASRTNLGVPAEIANGTLALATGAISSGTCTSAQTATATGVATTDSIIVSFNADPTGVTGYIPSTSGMLTIIVYPTLNTFNAKACNNTANSITPGAVTLNWRVVR